VLLRGARCPAVVRVLCRLPPLAFSSLTQ
jgi:hypothetical protein